MRNRLVRDCTSFTERKDSLCTICCPPECADQHNVEIKTAVLGYTALSLCSHQPAAIGVEFACGQHCNPESGITGSASSVQGVVLLRDLKLRFWETDVAWRDVTDVFGF